MRMIQDGVIVYCPPDGAYCNADEEKRHPLEIDTCPRGYEECTGDCFEYGEV